MLVVGSMHMEVTMQKKHVVTTWMSLMLWYKLALLSKLLLESSIEICDRICENPAKRGIFSFLIYSTSRLHGALGCLPPNMEAVAQAVFALRTTTLQYFC